MKITDKYIINKHNKFSSKNRSIVLNLPSHSIKESRRLWDMYDWSRGGEEWTEAAKTNRGLDPNNWKGSLINEMMLKYIKKGSTILEIGPGAGRWTEKLLQLAGSLILVDISKKCLELCRGRFKAYNNVGYYLIDGKLDLIANDSIDYIWSYDVFVHINPIDVESYIEDFRRVLKPGGHAIIHHSGDRYSKGKREAGFRSYTGSQMFSKLVARYKMKMLEQNASLSHLPGDIISVFMKDQPL